MPYTWMSSCRDSFVLTSCCDHVSLSPSFLPLGETRGENAASTMENEKGGEIDSLVIYLEHLDSTVLDANPPLEFSVMQTPKFHLCWS